MPSLFSWRPKIHLHLKKFSHQFGDPSPEDSPPRSVPELEPDSGYIVESAPPQNSDDEYFFSPYQSPMLGKSVGVPDKAGPERRPIRAVRFSDGVGVSKPPPVCNVIPNRNPAILDEETVRNRTISPLPPPYPSANSSPRLNWRRSAEGYESPATVRRNGREELSVAENHHPPRPARFSTTSNTNGNDRNQRSNRANILLQQLRVADDAHSESEMSTTNEPPPTMTTGASVVYLVFNDETKRSALPRNLYSVEQLKSLFLRSFPSLSAHYLNSAQVKLYIQETRGHQLFYELDDIKEVRDSSVLKIREQSSTGYHSPLPIRFTDSLVEAPPAPSSVADYVSEPEIDYDYSRRSLREHYTRPASVVPGEKSHQKYFGGKPSVRPPPSSHKFYPQPPQQQRHLPSPQFPASNYDSSYYDPYYSSDSSAGGRSGSSTPVQMEETRQRMDTMERQLAGLSSLVHSALIPKEMNPLARREMMELRRQIMELQPPMEAAAATNSDEFSTSRLTDSSTSTISGPPMNGQRNRLQEIAKEVSMTQIDLKQLGRLAQQNSQSGREVLNRVQEELKRLGVNRPGNLSTSAAVHNRQDLTPERRRVDELRDAHLQNLSKLQDSLQAFESNMEGIRSSVLNTNKKLRMTEVERLTNDLTEIGKSAAALKTEFPQLQTELERLIRENMKAIVREENFVREESQSVDNCLRRCKTLANMMVTLKKLAMVQDPGVKIHHPSRAEVKRMPKLTGIATTMFANEQKVNGHNLTATPKNPLDSVLEELSYQQAAKRNPTTAEVSATVILKTPPEPPERKRYNTNELKMLYMNGNGPADQKLPPNPLRSTNILDAVDSTSRLTIASSSESVNSQEGIRERVALPTNNNGK